MEPNPELPPPDLKLFELMKVDWHESIGQMTIQNEFLKSVHESLFRNARRVILGISILPHVWMVATNYERITAQNDDRPATKEEIKESFLSDWNSFTNDSLRLAVKAFEVLAQAPLYYEAFNSVMLNQVVAAWTAYEILATDLWVEAVNHRPKTLGKNAWIGTKRNGQEANAVKGFPIEILHRYDFDLSSNMGTMMKSERFYSFNKLDDISNAYRDAFRVVKNNGNSGTFQAISDLFASNDDLSVLESYRHVIVHRGARADAQFVERMTSRNRPAPKENEYMLLNGEIVSQLTKAAFSSAQALLKATIYLTHRVSLLQ